MILAVYLMLGALFLSPWTCTPNLYPLPSYLMQLMGSLCPCIGLLLWIPIWSSWEGWVGWGYAGGSEGKASAYSEGDLGSIPGSERSSGEGNGNPLQYSCLENPMDEGA